MLDLGTPHVFAHSAQLVTDPQGAAKRHLDKELQVRERGIKVLSLVFIDRVANYRDYDNEGKPVQGKFAGAFEDELGPG